VAFSVKATNHLVEVRLRPSYRNDMIAFGKQIHLLYVSQTMELQMNNLTVSEEGNKIPVRD
jgi:hypothetical protein